jgi:hypothetical protein
MPPISLAIIRLVEWKAPRLLQKVKLLQVDLHLYTSALSFLSVAVP